MRLLRSFLSDNRGVAALEMALVAPIVAGLAFVSVNLWDAAQRRENMDAALHTASQYYLNGGQSDDDAHQLAINGWRARPTSGTVTIERFCRCAGVSAVCSSLCASGEAPSVMVRIVGNQTTTGAVFKPTLSRSELLRVR